MKEKIVNPSPNCPSWDNLECRKISSTRHQFVCHETLCVTTEENKVRDAVPFRAAQITLFEYSIVFFFAMFFVYVN